MKIVFCTVYCNSIFANVMVVTQVLFHDPNNLINFDFMLKVVTIVIGLNILSETSCV